MQDINCPQCSNKIGLNIVTCPQCQTVQGFEAFSGVDPDIRIKNQRFAIWFSVLFGFLGVHKFYLGQHLKGSLYLVFCWTFVPMIIGWVDAVRTLKMSNLHFQERYSRKVSHYSA